MVSLFNASVKSEDRRLTLIGGGLAAVLIATGALAVANPFSSRSDDIITLTIETPYVGQGVATGTPIIMHGVEVGEVNRLSNLPSGGVKLETALQAESITGLTDSLSIDYRPANYFGVTGINVIPGSGGHTLHNNTTLTLNPKQNATLQAMLYKVGDLTHNVIDDRLVDVVQRGTQYLDGFRPLIETMLITAKTVADVQDVSTQQLLRNTTSVLVGAPPWLDSLTSVVDDFLHVKMNDLVAAEDSAENPYVSTYDQQMLDHYNYMINMAEHEKDRFAYDYVGEWFEGADTDLFSKVGNLLSSHQNDLYPVAREGQLLADLVPRIVNAERIDSTLREVQSRLNRMYEGSGDQRALQVRLVLDTLPTLSAPLGLVIGAEG